MSSPPLPEGPLLVDNGFDLMCNSPPISLSVFCSHPLFFSLPFSAYLQAVQASMILATIFCCISFFLFILQLFKLQQGERFLFTAIIQLLACK